MHVSLYIFCMIILFIYIINIIYINRFVVNDNGDDVFLFSIRISDDTAESDVIFYQQVYIYLYNIYNYIYIVKHYYIIKYSLSNYIYIYILYIEW